MNKFASARKKACRIRILSKWSKDTHVYNNCFKLRSRAINKHIPSWSQIFFKLRSRAINEHIQSWSQISVFRKRRNTYLLLLSGLPVLEMKTSLAELTKGSKSLESRSAWNSSPTAQSLLVNTFARSFTSSITLKNGW